MRGSGSSSRFRFLYRCIAVSLYRFLVVALSKSVQYLPKLLIDNQLIYPVNIDKPFEHLARFSDSRISDYQHKDELISLTNDLMTDIDAKPLHPKNKLNLHSRYVHFTVKSITKTWVIQIFIQ